MNVPDPPFPELQPGDTIRRQLPGRRPKDPTIWELRRDGKIVGRVQSAFLGSKIPRLFFHGFGIHPETGKTINLELSTDFTERVRAVFAFVSDPEPTRGIHWR